MPPVKTAKPAEQTPGEELLQLEIDSLRSELNSLKQTLQAVQDMLPVLAQDIETASRGKSLSLPKELVGKIDPALIYGHALAGATQAMLARTSNPKSFCDRAESNASIILDIAEAVLKSYVSRNGTTG
jgi:FtsZ-binding cell division protein ZapB